MDEGGKIWRDCLEKRVATLGRGYQAVEVKRPISSVYKTGFEQTQRPYFAL